MYLGRDTDWIMLKTSLLYCVFVCLALRGGKEDGRDERLWGYLCVMKLNLDKILLYYGIMV